MSQGVLWPPTGLGEALAQLAYHTDLIRPPAAPLPTPPATLLTGQNADLGLWLEQTADQLGLETEAISASYEEVMAFVMRAAPALLWVAPDQETKQLSASGERAESAGCILVLLKGASIRHPWQVALLKPDLTVHWVAATTVRKWLCQSSTSRHQAMLERLLDQLGLQGKAREQSYHALLQQQLSNQPVAQGWLVRLSPAAPFWQQIRQVQFQRPLFQLLGSYLAQLGITVLSWWFIGSSALNGHFAWVWLWAWALLLFTAIPLRLWTEQAQQALSEAFSVLSKQRLLYGILRLQPEQIRHQGAGQFFGQVMEADSLDNLALGGGLVAGLALLQVGVAVALLALATSLWILPALLLSWLLVLAGLLWLYLNRQRTWMASYRHMSSDLVERMVGHRTRLVQEAHEHWHDTEDRILANYHELAWQLDRVKSWLTGSVTRGWMVLALVGLTLTFWWTPMAKVNLPLAVAGILFALQTLGNISNGVVSLAHAASVWEQVRPLFLAAQQESKHRGEQTHSPPAPHSLKQSVGQPLLIAQGLEFRYRAEGSAIVREGNLQIRQGDRLLLEGASGGGKSTFAALLAGLRTPNAGRLLLYGYDRQALGTELWRRRVMLTPQFHENHIFSGSLAFNLLMGRCWPPPPADLQAATALCEELGLSELLERMPAGLHQMVGESGWRLSHGERSRVYIARTILQGADLMILDESFAALDPETMRATLDCVLHHAPTLLVIAHP